MNCASREFSTAVRVRRLRRTQARAALSRLPPFFPRQPLGPWLWSTGSGRGGRRRKSAPSLPLALPPQWSGSCLMATSTAVLVLFVNLDVVSMPDLPRQLLTAHGSEAKMVPHTFSSPQCAIDARLHDSLAYPSPSARARFIACSPTWRVARPPGATHTWKHSRS